MAAEKLDFQTTYQKQPSGTDGINDWLEIADRSFFEVFRVTSNESGDWVFCQRLHRITACLIQNHGATFATGVVRDEPKLTITQGGTTSNAKITITHSASRECFTIIVIGEL
uniref:Uncharacterized protein n=1 Tax=viral metagenome TaxID=1070528 RepID=A0A6M3LM36_9ZZZZ